MKFDALTLILSRDAIAEQPTQSSRAIHLRTAARLAPEISEVWIGALEGVRDLVLEHLRGVVRKIPVSLVGVVRIRRDPLGVVVRLAQCRQHLSKLRKLLKGIGDDGGKQRQVTAKQIRMSRLQTEAERERACDE